MVACTIRDIFLSEIGGIHMTRFSIFRFYDRAVMVCEYIIETKCTIRAAAKEFGIAKSTVERDIKLTKNLRPFLYREARRVIDKNLAERAIRGGLATRLKWKLVKQK